MPTTITSIPYLSEPWAAYAAQICQEYGFMLTGGRYTILGWEPLEVITDYHPGQVQKLTERLSSLSCDFSPCGGWYGYLGYELAESLHPRLEPRPRDLPLPDLCLGLYDRVLVFDHELHKAYAVDHGLRAPSAARIYSPPSVEYTLGSFQSNLDPQAYQKAFYRVVEALKRGDCYQANLAQRFTASFEGSPWGYFLSMLKSNPAPFGAYLQLPHAAIISCSPERFLRIDQDKIQTKPIKGTAPRFTDPELDLNSAQALVNSLKNRAENLMIVDLMRNDLGKICRPGSVQVPQLFGLESFRSVHHLVSTVNGQLRPKLTPLEAFFACFPGGSITGAPKLAALQLIRALEPNARHVYCGSIGYADFSGVLDMNIAIRTAVIAQGECQVWAGGGLVLDSTWKEEHEECLHKIQPFLSTSPLSSRERL